MPRTLTFVLGDEQFTVTPSKVDRKKLYGWTGIVAIDDEGYECSLVTTDETGTVIIPRGGTGLGILTPEGEWVSRSELIAVTADGNPAPIYRSSYNGQVQLTGKITVGDFLNYSITAFYELADSAELASVIGKDIYRFDYSYLDSYITDNAFLLVPDLETANTVFMLLGYENIFEFLSLEQPGWIEETGDELEEEPAGLDFSMF